MLSYTWLLTITCSLLLLLWLLLLLLMPPPPPYHSICILLLKKIINAIIYYVLVLLLECAMHMLPHVAKGFADVIKNLETGILSWIIQLGLMWSQGALYKERGRRSEQQKVILLAQVRVPNAQRGQTNWNIDVWSRESFIAGPCKELGASCPKKPWAPRRVSAKHF